MKATGIIRNIDDLGRICIPKEVRRTLRIHENDSFEVFIGRDGEVIFQKVNFTPNRDAQAQDWLQAHKAEMEARSVRFSIEGDTTTCEGITANRRVIGTAKRNPSDPICPAVGMVYAYCRAFRLALPDGWY